MRRKKMSRKKPEQYLLRGMVLAAALLAIFQLGSATDPLEFYLRMAGEIDSPAFKYEDTLQPVQAKKSVSLSFTVLPEDAQVYLVQEGEILGVLQGEKVMSVRQGTVELRPAVGTEQAAVEIKANGKSWVIELAGGKKTFDVRLEV